MLFTKLITAASIVGSIAEAAPLYSVSELKQAVKKTSGNFIGNSSILSYPFPILGTPLLEYGQALQEFFLGVFGDDVPTPYYAAMLPQLTNDINLQVLEPFINKTEFNNYNIDFLVSGVDDGRATWFVEAPNRTSDDPVILYSHGGGYAFGLYPTFCEMLREIYYNASNPRLSILLLDYTVTAVSPFPKQIQEAALVYNRLAESSDNIILGGDSAGGHLSLSVVRHISYPYDDVEVIYSNNKPKGVFLMSPWVNIHPDNTTGYHASNYGKDIFTPATLDGMGELLVGNRTDLLDDESLNFYEDKEAAWSKELFPSNYSTNVFITYGEDEVLRGDIESFISLANIPSSNVYQQPNGVHDSAIFLPQDSQLPLEVGKFLQIFGTTASNSTA